MEPRPAADTQGRALSGAFHDYVRAVFAQDSTRARLLLANRARSQRRLALQRPASGAEQRWEDEGGSSR